MRVRMCGVYDRGGGLKEHKQRHGGRGGHGYGTADAPDAEGNHTAALVQTGRNAFPNGGRNGFFRVL